MNKNMFSSRLHDAVEYYYQFNPNTLMPLLMLALATRGELKITEKHHSSAFTACSLDINEIKSYEWVKYNDKLNKKVSSWVKKGVGSLSVEMEIGRSLYPIYQTFLRNDTKDIIQEYHHRLGLLVHHSSNAASEAAHRKYATYLLAEAILDAPLDFLVSNYIQIFNHLLEKSTLQPKRPRMYIAHALCALLKYKGRGLVYNPFAGCSIAGAMLQPGENFYGDGDGNDKIYATGLLLNYGMGISNEHFIQRDSTKWLEDKKIDYVVSTYTGYIGKNTAFDFCLGKCLEDKKFKGKYAGMVNPREIFEKMTDNFREALDRNWIDTIVLLPFGEAAVLVDAKKNRNNFINFINCNNPLTRRISILELLEDNMYADHLEVDDVKQDGYLKSLVAPDMADREGYDKVYLRDLVRKIPRRVYDLDDFEEDEKVLAYVDRNETWYGNRWNENIKRRRINNLFAPAYLLDQDSLIVNKKGDVEPRLFDADDGSAFFEDGYAFTAVNSENIAWIASELEQRYVHNQLHPYGDNEMVPEPVSEDDFLNLIIYKEHIEDLYDSDMSDCCLNDTADNDAASEDDKYPLEAGYVLKDGNMKYTILNFIANGCFGYTYKAEMLNCSTGAKEIVAIKEFFPQELMSCQRVNNIVTCDPKYQDRFLSDKHMFLREPELIKSISGIDGNHVTEIKSSFEYEPTGTAYYVMKYYAGESLNDMIFTNQIPSSEDLIVKKIIIPMCKALNAMHSLKILHLDIKPDNVVIDDNGEAVLIDFGTAVTYDEQGRLLEGRDADSSTGPFSAPENSHGHMNYFAPASDIFGLAATLYNMFSKEYPRPVKMRMDEYDDAEKYMSFMDAYLNMDCSDQMKDAVISGLNMFANDRPQNAQQFLNLFPGCEDIKL